MHNVKAENLDGTFNIFNANTGEWVNVTKDYLNCINTKDIKEIEERGNKLLVTYKNGRIYVYDNVFGTWGNEIEIV